MPQFLTETNEKQSHWYVSEICSQTENLEWERLAISLSLNSWNICLKVAPEI